MQKPSHISSTDLIKQLRFETGAPILECRKALLASKNDLKDATQWLREHGAAKVAKTNRDAKDGLVGLFISDDAKSAGFVQVQAETDFTARSAEFISLVSKTAQTVSLATQNADIPMDDVLQLKHDGTTPIKQLVEDAIVAIRENISVSQAINFQVDADRDSFLVGYAHNRVETTLGMAGTAAAIVELERVDPDLPEVNMRAIGKKLAMHIVAVSPAYLHPNEVPLEDIENERNLITEQMVRRRHDDAVIKKNVAGALKKYFRTICLSEQVHSIEETIPNIGVGMKELGVEIKRFKRLEVC